MFDATFLDTLADAVAQKVIARLERHAQEKSGLAEWLDRYGPVMTRDEVADALKITKRHVINLEGRGKLARTEAPGKQVKYDTARIFELVTKQQQRYANH